MNIYANFYQRQVLSPVLQCCQDKWSAARVAALKAAGCSVVREEKKSGTTRNGRAELETLLAFIDEGAWAISLDLSRIKFWLPILMRYCPQHPLTQDLKWDLELYKMRKETWLISSSSTGAKLLRPAQVRLNIGQ